MKVSLSDPYLIWCCEQDFASMWSWRHFHLGWRVFYVTKQPTYLRKLFSKKVSYFKASFREVAIHFNDHVRKEIYGLRTWKWRRYQALNAECYVSSRKSKQLCWLYNVVRLKSTFKYVEVEKRVKFSASLRDIACCIANSTSDISNCPWN